MEEIFGKPGGPMSFLEKDVSFTLKDPHGHIQFKGTEICLDVHCACGEDTHIDGMFVYIIKCGSCGALYELNPHIKLEPLEKPFKDWHEPRITT